MLLHISGAELKLFDTSTHDEYGGIESNHPVARFPEGY